MPIPSIQIDPPHYEQEPDDDIELQYAPLGDAELDPDDIEQFFPPNDEPEPRPEIPALPPHVAAQWKRTAYFLGTTTKGTLEQRTVKLMKLMKKLDLNIPALLGAISHQNQACSDNHTLERARNILLQSKELPDLLHRWRDPTKYVRETQDRYSRCQDAKEVLNNFATICSQEKLLEELDSVADLFTSSATDDNDVEVDTLLKSADFSDLADKLEERVPMLWNTMMDLSAPQNQLDRATRYGQARNAAVLSIAMASYSRCQTRNKIQKILTIYFKYHGTTVRAMEILHQMRLVMSSRWGNDCVSRLSKKTMEKVQDIVKKAIPFVVVYDNMQIPRPVFEQRINNKNDFLNGTAGMLLGLPEAPKFTPEDCKSFREQHNEGIKNPIDAPFIKKLGDEGAAKLQPFLSHKILRLLLDSAGFDLKTYRYKDDPLLAAPDALNQLPFGPEHVAQQHVIGSLDIPEDSIAGNIKIVHEIIDQIGIRTIKQKRKLANNNLVFVVGDQMTAARQRSISELRTNETNPFLNCQWKPSTFAFFHTVLTWAQSLYKQFYGTSSSEGLRRAFLQLKRKGLTKPQIKGTFYHHLHEGLQHFAEARILNDWLEVSGTSSVTDLREKTPQELIDLSQRLLQEFASTNALEELKNRETGNDEARANITMCNRDILHYMVFCDAMKTGDVGVMEASLPFMLARFIGGANFKYANEIIELLQLLHREWPPQVADFVRRYCWLVNFTPYGDQFHALDLAMEHVIRDIKVTFFFQGPNITWDYLKTLHPVIPTIRELSSFIEAKFKALSRGKRHTSPKKDDDIKLLQDQFTQSGHHKYIPGRTLHSDEQFKDFFKNGSDKLLSGNYIQSWMDRRVVYEWDSTKHCGDNCKDPEHWEFL